MEAFFGKVYWAWSSFCRRVFLAILPDWASADPRVFDILYLYTFGLAWLVFYTFAVYFIVHWLMRRVGILDAQTTNPRHLDAQPATSSHLDDQPSNPSHEALVMGTGLILNYGRDVKYAGSEVEYLILHPRQDSGEARVAYNRGQSHGRWDTNSDGSSIVVEFHCKGDEKRIRQHIFASTGVEEWKLTEADGATLRTGKRAVTLTPRFPCQPRAAPS